MHGVMCQKEQPIQWTYCLQREIVTTLCKLPSCLHTALYCKLKTLVRLDKDSLFELACYNIS